MHILRDTPFQFAPFVWSLRPPRPSLTLVVKATYRLPEAGGACTLLEEQPPCEGERFHDDDPGASLRFDSDLAVFKPRGEWVLAGTCHAPGGRPASTVLVRVAVGRHEKSLAVIGDRVWKQKMLGDAMSEPVPFRKLPLRPERAFGGPGQDANPLGIGSPRAASAKQKLVLPNLELPHKLIRGPSDRPPPAITTPRGAAWPERLALAGTYDAAWRRKRWPWFPEDLELAYFNSAPRDQQIDGYWRGDEALVLTGLHPKRPTLQARLPGHRARALLLEHDGPVAEATTPGRLREIPLALDTIAVDADALLVHCLWRGVTEVASASLEQLEAALVTHEPPGSSESLGELAARLPELARRHGVALVGASPELPAGVGAPAGGGAGSSAASSPSERRREVRARRLAGVASPVALVPAPASSPRSSAQGPRPVAAEVAARGRALVEERLAAHAPLRGLDLSGADLSGCDLRRADLSGCVLTDANLRGALLERARLADASLLRADLSEASAARVDLTRACLDAARLARADLRWACLLAASAEGASFEGARLDEVLADDSCLHGASLVGASLVGAHLGRADLSGVRCDRADFSGAVLSDALLSDATGEDVVLDRADLTGLRAAGRTALPGARLRRVSAARSRWAGARLEEADFGGALLERADLGGSRALAARFDGADLRDACLRGAVLVGASFLRANAMHAVFEAADLSHADLRGACLYEAELHEARTEGTRVEATNLAGTKLALR